MENVLILVLLDDALRHIECDNCNNCMDCVLILVLLDDALRRLGSLTPTPFFVLILVLLDDALRLTRVRRKIIFSHVLILVLLDDALRLSLRSLMGLPSMS